MRLATCKGLIMGTIFDFTTVDMDCTILKFIFSLASKLSTYIYYLLSVATCSKEKIKKERKKFQAQAPASLMSILLLFVFALSH
jgi:hypothetical protein